MELNLYRYLARVRSVYDGDTCTVDIDLGLGTWLHGEKIRLYRINTPELRGSDREAGLRARDFLRSKIDGKVVYLSTVKDKKGKYGRYITDIWFQEDSQWLNANDLLVQEGYAVYQEY